MAGFLFAMLAVLATGLGARDQVLVAHMAPRRAVLAVALVCTLIASLLAGWAGQSVAPLMTAPARMFLVAMALGLAALELLVIRPGRKPIEPTQSLGAFFLVLLAQQLFDASRFTLFAIAAASPAAWTAVAGGILGSATSVSAGWLGGATWQARPLTLVRRGLGAAMLLLALYLAYPAIAARLAA
ncbi:hypothetical protein [Novosphingobium sp.]|uniref:hypothetical protein n=1 Tax=Novosphingobium sp. TaxID=1874826 RepID=UPI00286C0A9A|nr:hypothetical protein [Novosphingobium sp.]